MLRIRTAFVMAAVGLSSLCVLALTAGEPTIESLRAKAQERMELDRKLMSDDEFRAMETTYQEANRNLRAPGAAAALQEVIDKYPKSDRAGCAVLYLAQMSMGSAREGYLKTAIEKFGDTWYGDGVQVGALARAQLAIYYANNKRAEDATKLAHEIVTKFPGAIDHSGARLADGLRTLKLLE